MSLLLGVADDENPIIVVELEFVASFHWALNTRFDCLLNISDVLSSAIASSVAAVVMNVMDSVGVRTS